MQPISFTDPRRCDGEISDITKRPKEPCAPCLLRLTPPDKNVFWIAPARYSYIDAQGRECWGCRTREGLHDGVHCAPVGGDGASLDLGKVGTPSGAGCASISADRRAGG